MSGVSVNGATLLSQSTYEPFGPNGGWVWGNSGVTANHHLRVYDLDGRLTTVQSDPQGYARVISYDNANRISGLTDPTASANNLSYGYDKLDRLTSALLGPTGVPSTTYGFGYDAVGNRSSQQVNAATTGYTYVATSNRLMSLSGAQAKTFGYDAAGNLASDGSYNYIYDGSGRRTQLKQGNKITATYQVNALGQRVTKTIGKIASYFAYDEAGHLVGA